jgi:hypothetical protein
MAEKSRICAAFQMANRDGLSGLYLLRQNFSERGQPAYLAKVVMEDAKALCPNIY